MCHANFPQSPVPDLRRSTAATHAAFNEIVLRGALQPRGMPSWDDQMSESDANQVHAYVISVARQAYADQQKNAAPAAAAPAQGQGHL
jgi:quinohemoprotein ethanol dehydrogenase